MFQLISNFVELFSVHLQVPTYMFYRVPSSCDDTSIPGFGEKEFDEKTCNQKDRSYDSRIASLLMYFNPGNNRYTCYSYQKHVKIHRIIRDDIKSSGARVSPCLHLTVNRQAVPGLVYSAFH